MKNTRLEIALIVAPLVLVFAAGTAYRPAKADATAEIYSSYKNTKDATTEPGAPATVTTVQIDVPPGATGVIGWRLSLFANDENEDNKWVANATLITDDHPVDHCKDRQSKQCEMVVLSDGHYLGIGSGVFLTLNLKNRDTVPVSARANAWVLFKFN